MEIDRLIFDFQYSLRIKAEDPQNFFLCRRHRIVPDVQRVLGNVSAWFGFSENIVYIRFGFSENYVMQGMDAMKYIVREIDEDLIAWKRALSA